MLHLTQMSMQCTGSATDSRYVSMQCSATDGKYRRSVRTALPGTSWHYRPNSNIEAGSPSNASCYLPRLRRCLICQLSVAGGTLQQTLEPKSTSKLLAIEAGGPQAQSNSTSTKISLFFFGRLPSSGSGSGARRFSQGGRGLFSSIVIPLPQ